MKRNKFDTLIFNQIILIKETYFVSVANICEAQLRLNGLDAEL